MKNADQVEHVRQVSKSKLKNKNNWKKKLKKIRKTLIEFRYERRNIIYVAIVIIHFYWKRKASRDFFLLKERNRVISNVSPNIPCDIKHDRYEIKYFWFVQTRHKYYWLVNEMPTIRRVFSPDKKYIFKYVARGTDVGLNWLLI